MHYAHRKSDLSQRAIGASLAMAAGVGLVWLASNMAFTGSAVTEPPLIWIPPSDSTPLPPDDLQPKDVSVDLEDLRPLVDVPVIPIDPVLPPLPPTGGAITVTTGGPVFGTGGGTTLAPPPKVVAPVLRKFDPPPYPERGRELREEGLTTLSYCVGVNGRATKVQLAQTSGHRRLDDAAIKWLGQQRFTPGTIDGAASEMCRTFVYEWTLKP